MDLNKVILVGRVTADPQIRTTPGGQSVTTIGVATNRTWTDKAGQKQEQAEFHNVVVWGRQAEIAGQYLTRGAMVLIEGRIATRGWTDKQGQQRKTTEIMCERLQLGPRAAGGGGGGQGGGYSSNSGGGSFSSSSGSSSHASSGGNESAPGPSLDEIPVINLDEEEIKPEDIPF
jgi:single-strand DNA-binding protein